MVRKFRYATLVFAVLPETTWPPPSCTWRALGETQDQATAVKL
jgi:hypothetical protein